MSWSISDARARFADLIREAEDEPQIVERHGRPVVAVVSAEEFEAFASWRARGRVGTLAEALAEVARTCAEEDFELVAPPRSDRPNPFSDPE